MYKRNHNRGFFCTHGIPCCQLVRIAIALPEDLIRDMSIKQIIGERLRLELLFDEYWKIDIAGVSKFVLEKLRKRNLFPNLEAPIRPKNTLKDDCENDEAITPIKIISVQNKELSRLVYSTG